MSDSTIEHQRVLAEMRKLNEEGAKFLAEQKNLNSETLLNDKKTKWYEFTMIIALIAATIAATKLFL